MLNAVGGREAVDAEGVSEGEAGGVEAARVDIGVAVRVILGPGDDEVAVGVGRHGSVALLTGEFGQALVLGDTERVADLAGRSQHGCGLGAIAVNGHVNAVSVPVASMADHATTWSPSASDATAPGVWG